MSADKPEPDVQAALTVTVAGGCDGLQGVVLVDPATGAHYRPGCTVTVPTGLAREWQKQGWVTIADDPLDVDDSPDEADAATPPAAPARRKRPATKA